MPWSALASGEKLTAAKYNERLASWIFLQMGAATIGDSYNVTSIVDNGAGDFDINWDIDFANATYAPVALPGTTPTDGNTQALLGFKAIAAGTLTVRATSGLTTNTDFNVGVAAMGDQT